MRTAKSKMPTYKLMIEKMSVPDDGGQGFVEGDLEVRIFAAVIANGQELGKNYPASAGSSIKLKAGGDVKIINEAIGELSERSKSEVYRTINIEVTEIDKGTLGGDDTGSGALTFTLKDGMKPSRKTATIDLYRPNMGKPLGKVSVTLYAEQLN